MDINNLKGLMEAYQQVNAPQEIDEKTAMAKRGYDEAPIRQKIAKSTGGGEAADRASALEKKSTFGDAKKAKQRTDYARKQRGDFRKTTSSSPGLHGYAHKSDDAGVKAKQAARGAQRGALTPAEKKQFNREEFDVFETVLEFLCVEGYAETLEEAEWMMANIINEEAIAIIVEAMHGEKEDDEEMKNGKKSKKSEEEDDDEDDEEELDEAIYSRKGLAKAAEMIAKRSTPSGRAKSGKGADVAHIRQIRGSGRGDFDREGLGGTPMTPTMAKNPIKKQNYVGTGNRAARRAGTYKEAFEAWLDEAMTNYEKNRKRAAQRAAARNAARDQGKTGAVPGVGYVTPRRERETWTDESGKTRHAKGL
jgi:hypothetical protein